MKNSRVTSMPKIGVAPLSRRDVLYKGALVVSVLALPVFVGRKAWGQTITTFDFYISPSGSDSNAGTSSSPWAITSLQDNNPNNGKMTGKRVGLIAGTYDLASMSSGSNAGDYQHPILSIPGGTFVGSCNSAGIYTPRVAILNMGRNGTANSMIGQNPGGAGNWTLDGVVLDGGGSGQTGFGYNGSLISYFPGGGAAPHTVQNCEIRNIAAQGSGNNVAGIFVQGSRSGVIYNNYFHDIYKTSQADHCHGYEEYNCVNTQIYNNTFINCSEHIDAKVGNSGTTVYQNYFGPTSNGVALRGFDGAEGNPNSTNSPYVIHHNVFDGAGASHAPDVNNVTAQQIIWYNNTIYDTRSGSRTILDLRGSGSYGVITSYNNILVGTAGDGTGAGGYALTSGQFAESNFNCFALASLGAMCGDGSTTYSSLAAWQGAAGRPDLNSIAGSPSLPAFAAAVVSGAGANQFQLSAGSACKGAGRTGGSSGGTPCDMGAWANGVTRIGSSLSGGGGAANPVPNAPSLTVS
jgi:hypothetical protein